MGGGLAACAPFAHSDESFLLGPASVAVDFGELARGSPRSSHTTRDGNDAKQPDEPMPQASVRQFPDPTAGLAPQALDDQQPPRLQTCSA